MWRCVPVEIDPFVQRPFYWIYWKMQFRPSLRVSNIIRVIFTKGHPKTYCFATEALVKKRAYHTQIFEIVEKKGLYFSFIHDWCASSLDCKAWKHPRVIEEYFVINDWTREKRRSRQSVIFLCLFIWIVVISCLHFQFWTVLLQTSIIFFAIAFHCWHPTWDVFPCNSVTSIWCPVWVIILYDYNSMRMPVTAR